MKYIKLIGSGLITIGVSILFLGLKIRNYNLFFLILGGLMALVGIVAVVFINRKEENTANYKYIVWKKNLMDYGLRIEVDLDKVEIKSNNYREEIVNEGYSEIDKYKALDTLVGKDNREFKIVKESVLIYESDILGQKSKFYSPIIPKDGITLQFLLGNQKKTFIYLDKSNPHNYFFDLEFLDLY